MPTQLHRYLFTQLLHYLPAGTSTLTLPQWLMIADGLFFGGFIGSSYLFTTGLTPTLFYFGIPGYLRMKPLMFSWVRRLFMLFANHMLINLLLVPVAYTMHTPSLAVAAAHLWFVTMIAGMSVFGSDTSSMGVLVITEVNGVLLHAGFAMAQVYIAYQQQQRQTSTSKPAPSTYQRPSTVTYLSVVTYGNLLLRAMGYGLLPQTTAPSMFLDTIPDSHYLAFMRAAGGSAIYALLVHYYIMLQLTPTNLRLLCTGLTLWHLVSVVFYTGMWVGGVMAVQRTYWELAEMVGDKVVWWPGCVCDGMCEQGLQPHHLHPQSWEVASAHCATSPQRRWATSRRQRWSQGSCWNASHPSSRPYHCTYVCS